MVYLHTIFNTIFISWEQRIVSNAYTPASMIGYIFLHHILQYRTLDPLATQLSCIVQGDHKAAVFSWLPKEMRLWVVVTWLFVCGATALAGGEQPLSRVAIERTILAVDDSVHVKASPLVLGLKGENSGWVEVEFFHPNPSKDDWIGVFSPANFSDAICEPENNSQQPPLLCTAPIKYQFAKFKNNGYTKSGKGNLKLS
ncbi:hypothetical protein ACQ4PT_045332 [Festuca glaucescens]